jgi:hypothetical protein
VIAPVLATGDLPRLIPGVVPAEKLVHPGRVAEGFRPAILAFEPAYSFLSRRFHKRQPSFFGIPGSIPIELPKLAWCVDLLFDALLQNENPKLKTDRQKTREV